MKASELIAALQTAIAEHGDRVVVAHINPDEVRRPQDATTYASSCQFMPVTIEEPVTMITDRPDEPFELWVKPS